MFGQNKIGHEFCLPKTDSSNFTSSMKNQPTLFKTCNLYSRHRKVSIPASFVSNNIKPGFHVVVPTSKFTRATEGSQEKPCHCFLHFVCFVLSGVLNRLRVSNLVQHTSQHVQAPSVFSDNRKQVTSDIQRIHDKSDRHTNKQAQVCCKNVCLWHFIHF